MNALANSRNFDAKMMCIYIYTCVYIYIHTYIYIYCMCAYICVWVWVWVARMLGRGPGLFGLIYFFPAEAFRQFKTYIRKSAAGVCADIFW